MNLNELQTTFMALLCRRSAFEQENTQADIARLNKKFTDTLEETRPLNSAQRLSIYQNAYRSRLFSTIDDSYPCLGSLLGDELYNALINSYIDQHPSTSPSIDKFGSKLPSFISAFEPICHQLIAVELCAFEYQLQLTFNAKDSVPIGAEFLQSVPDHEWPNLKFKLTPGFSLKHFRMNTCEVWQALKDEGHPKIQTLAHPKAWIIWRQELVTQFQSVETDEACLLELVEQGHTFESLCEALLEWWPEEKVPERAFQLLHKWLGLGLLS